MTEIDYAAARALAEAEIHAPGYPADPDPADLVIVDDATLERPYGWVFSYDSRRHQQTGAFEDMLLGNVPILVTRSGAVHVLGTAHSVEWYLTNFEATGDPHQVSAAVEAAERAARQRERALRRAVAETLLAGWPALQAARGAAAEYARNATTSSVCALLEAGAPDDAVAAHLAAAEAQWLGVPGADPHTLAPLAARLRLVKKRLDAPQ